MEHPSNNEILIEERLEEYNTNAAYVWLFVRFRDEGLSCLENDGTIGGQQGLEVMKKVLNYFIGKEHYERCAVISDRIDEYHQREWLLQKDGPFTD